MTDIYAILRIIRYLSNTAKPHPNSKQLMVLLHLSSNIRNWFKIHLAIIFNSSIAIEIAKSVTRL